MSLIGAPFHRPPESATIGIWVLGDPKHQRLVLGSLIDRTLLEPDSRLKEVSLEKARKCELTVRADIETSSKPRPPPLAFPKFNDGVSKVEILALPESAKSCRYNWSEIVVSGHQELSHSAKIPDTHLATAFGYASPVSVQSFYPTHIALAS